MTSRMERYSSTEARSKKNEDLYKKIQDYGNYSNIETVTEMEHANEVDITKIKEMLKNRENYHKEKKYREIIKEKKKEEPEKVDPLEKERVHNVSDVLKQAREDRNTTDERAKYRSLKNTQYDILKKLNISDKKKIEEDEELLDMVNTVSMKTRSGTRHADDLGLFDDLKSDTMVGDIKSIKPYLDKEDIDDTGKTNYTEEIDKTFYTSSLGFSDDDFEDLKDLQKSVNKNNKLLKVLIVVVVIVIACIAGYFIYKKVL